MHHTPAPSPWVTRFAHLIAPSGSVLDLACGSGRHARLFLDRGHPVTALDKDISQALFAADAERIQADLEDGSPWPLADRLFAGIVVTNYLWRPIFPQILKALAPAGVLIFETFADGQQHVGRPRNPDFLLRRGELLNLCQTMEIRAFEDGPDPDGTIRQRICAIRLA